MSYNQKPPGTGGAASGTGPPNGPNNTQQVAKTLAGIQQQMQNFVHVQNALPQSSQADFNTLLHQQRLQNMLKQQQQHLIHQHFQQQMQQQQQHQQQQQQQQSKDRVGTEPLALTRTPAAAELLNKTYQQHHQQHPNGNPNASNSATLNPFQQQLQVITPNLVQQIQAFQLQMQQHQQQQQHHSQTQQSQHHTTPTGPLQSLPQQQMHGQSAQQQKSALTTAAAVAAAQLQQRYLSAVSAQTAASQVTGGNKVGNTAPPPLTTNQIKPPNLPPSTQITPVSANSGAPQSAVKSTATTNTSVTATAVVSPTKQVSPSISLLPSKASTITTSSTPIAAHQQNKFHANRNSTPATSSSATPTPAHVQKTTSSAVPLGGNTSSLPTASSSDSTTKQNMNADTVASTAALTSLKTPQKNTATQPGKSSVSPTALPSSVATIITKPQLSHGSVTPKQVTTNFHSQLPPPKSLQSVSKPAENRTECATQNSTEPTNPTLVTKPIPVQETKSASAINETGGKSDISVAISKVDVPKNEAITVAVNSVPKATHQSTTFTSEKEAKEPNAAQGKNVSKNEQITAKTNNNNVAEKDKREVKEETSAIIAHSKAVEPVKKLNKERNEEQIKQIETKSVETTINKASTNADITLSSEDLTSKPLKSESDKKPQHISEPKKPSAESDNTVEQNKISNEQSQENEEQKSNHNKDNDSFKEDDIKEAKDEKSESKPKTITESSETIVTPSTSNSKAKVSKESDTIANSESTSLKKPNRQLKSNKIAPSVSSAGSVQSAEKLTETPEKSEKSDKNEKVEKGNSNRTLREEKRKAQKTPVENSGLSTPTTPRETSGSSNDRKSQRHRLKTILYQSPLPELAFITKLSASEASNSPKPMSGEDKLIVFYKNEYMAVRNAEGTFYLCQTMQNVYRTSPRISIRWLSEDAKDSTIYIPDFYDHTDIECVLTTVELKRIDKGHLRLPETEKARIENILKKAIDVEKGLVPRPELTEENPDGLDISLYKDESQIEKKLSGSQTPVSSVRNSRRSTNANTTKSTSKTNTPSKAAGIKRKATNNSGGSSAKKSKSPTKKRKPPMKRKSTRGTTTDEENETSEDHASDAEYKPSQKKSNVNMATKASPRVQRSPLAKARVASPVASTSTSSRIKNPASKVSAPTPTPSRGERATKRKAGVENVTDSTGSPAKKVTSSNVNSAESTPNVNPTKSNSTKGKETTNNDETSSKKSVTEASSTSVAVNSSLQTTQADSENSTANGSSSHNTTTASRPTRSRK